MSILLNYFIESGIALAVFYLFYYVFLRKEKFFRLNRWYLLVSIVLSLLIPLFNFQASAIADNTTTSYMLESIQIRPATDFIKTNGREISVAKQEKNTWISIIWVLGSTLLIIRFLYQLSAILKLMISTPCKKEKKYSIYYHNQPIGSFSFFNHIFIQQKKLSNSELQKIVVHETTHARQWHSFDILFVEIITVFLWFNPFVWIYRKSLKEIHEYLADESVMQQSESLQSYIEILFSQIVGVRLVLGNHFNHSLIKKRIVMLQKNEKSRLAKLKVLLVVPFMALLVLNFACSENEPVEDEEVQIASSHFSYDLTNANLPRGVYIQTHSGEILRYPLDKEEILDTKNENGVVVVGYTAETTNSNANLEKDFGKVVARIENTNHNPAADLVDVMPEYPGGEMELRNYLMESLTYPGLARENGLEGKVYVQFTIDKTGKVINPAIVRGVHILLDEEAFRVVKNMPTWKPGEKGGKKINVHFTVPISFSLNNKLK